MEELLYGHSKDEYDVHQKMDVEEDGEVVTEDGINAQVDDETLRMGSVAAYESFYVTLTENGVGNGKIEQGLASSSSSDSSDDEDAKVVVRSAEIYDKVENGALDLIVEGGGAEIESNPIIEELKDVEVIEEHISKVEVIEEHIGEVEVIEEHNSEVGVMEEHINKVVEKTADEAKGYVEEEREVIITEESQTVEATAVELADVESEQVESAEEVFSAVLEQRYVEYADQDGTNGTLQNRKEENDSFPAIAKSSNGTGDPSHKGEFPGTNGNPQIISISARTMQPTSWRGCCGLLEVFKRGDR